MSKGLSVSRSDKKLTVTTPSPHKTPPAPSFYDHAKPPAKTSTYGTGQPIRSYQDLRAHLATLTRNTSHLGSATFDQISEPTPTQRRLFELLGVPIPLTLA